MLPHIPMDRPARSASQCNGGSQQSASDKSEEKPSVGTSLPKFSCLPSPLVTSKWIERAVSFLPENGFSKNKLSSLEVSPAWTAQTRLGLFPPQNLRSPLRLSFSPNYISLLRKTNMSTTLSLPDNSLSLTIAHKGRMCPPPPLCLSPARADLCCCCCACSHLLPVHLHRLIYSKRNASSWKEGEGWEAGLDLLPTPEELEIEKRGFLHCVGPSLLTSVFPSAQSSLRACADRDDFGQSGDT